MTLQGLERNARELRIGQLRILFSYDDPVAFVDAHEAVRTADTNLSKASRAHIRRWAPLTVDRPLREVDGPTILDAAAFQRILTLACLAALQP